MKKAGLLLTGLSLLLLLFPFSCLAAEAAGNIGTMLPIWSILPFAGILLSIALMPLFVPHFWHYHFPKVSAFWAVSFAVPFLYFFREIAVHEIAHIIIIDYIPFILLLWALFTVSGGIYVKGSLKGTPAVNTVILLIGTLLASVIGTTGASMLMIRPILRSNAWRVHKVHTIVFFIFLVSNIGGALTPLGDPPLFLGFLHGVPFFWTMHILPEMAFASVVLLVSYFIMDSYFYKKESKPDAPDTEPEPLSIEGSYNFIFLAGIIAAVLFSGTVKLGDVNLFGIHQAAENLIKDVVLILMGVLSLVFTKTDLRKGNEFSWAPIMEVAYLFAGIFITIIPALAILKAGEQGALAWLIKSISTPAQYFWAVGSLSSFLDNAPTYLTFFNSVLGKFYPGIPEAQAVSALIVEKIPYLAAISAGAVFMGANTYIGNAPNFMVKSIAEEAGVKMPSFFGYMFKYSIPILITLFVLITFVFF
ncbi:MAG TPA: sodium:proton antiporter [Smithellaceae bacterium]|jgi:Na+/H+ antiporter NhaD/arsenite permease-like protein|nr:sodium:proton antiporter [Smithella sp.]HNZ10069.1 sodium:proton antiporter [Smithellaceae bacterium]HOG81835.1 sodium:proton antiporter [Smithellaceae bacterium]HOQ41036.1 sodium:proton antiporter [Smithellaceae bacterium]HPL67266.1 sodium:proton antiporter [Smithellaceae bacterium]